MAQKSSKSGKKIPIPDAWQVEAGVVQLREEEFCRYVNQVSAYMEAQEKEVSSKHREILAKNLEIDGWKKKLFAAQSEHGQEREGLFSRITNKTVREKNNTLKEALNRVTQEKDDLIKVNLDLERCLHKVEAENKKAFEKIAELEDNLQEITKAHHLTMETSKDVIENLEKDFKLAQEKLTESDGLKLKIVELEKNGTYLEEVMEVMQKTMLEGAGIKDKRVDELESTIKDLGSKNANLHTVIDRLIKDYDDKLASKNGIIVSLNTKLTLTEQNVTDLLQSNKNFEESTLKAVQDKKNALTELEKLAKKLEDEKADTQHKMLSLKKEWEDLARAHYNEEMASAGRRFRRLLAARDLGFLEVEKDNEDDYARMARPRSSMSDSSMSSFDVVIDATGDPAMELIQEEDSASESEC